MSWERESMERTVDALRKGEVGTYSIPEATLKKALRWYPLLCCG